MRHHALSVSALTVAFALLGSACSSTPPPSSQYEEYQCPVPIGRIVREDCSKVETRYDGMRNSGPAASGGGPQAQAMAEANSLLSVLEEQRVSLCNDFNTCKMTVEQYRSEKQRVESSFTAVVALRGSVDKLDPAAVAGLMDQLRAIRSGKPAPPPPPRPVASAPPPPPPKPAPPPPPPPPSASSAGMSWIPGKYMLQAVGRVADAAHNLESKTNFGFDIDHACLLGAYLHTGKHIDIVQTFKAGRQYVLLGGGSENAVDVDLGILDSNGRLLVADTDDDPSPLVKFKPLRDGEYTIRLALEKSKSSGNFVALAVMHEGGYSIPPKNMVASIGRAVMSAAAVSKKLGAKGNDLVFHESNNWALYGTVLKPQEVSSFGGITLVTTPTIALAGADDQGTNIDMYLKDQGTGAIVAKDSEPDATPALVISPRAGARYSLSVANAARQGTTLATALLLDVK